MALLKIWTTVTCLPLVEILCTSVLGFGGIPFLLKKITLAKE